MKQGSDMNPEQAMKKLQKIFKKRGTQALEMARKEMLQEKIESPQARQALTYFMTKYWHDLARPTLLSLVCEAVNGDPELTRPIAVPLTLISGAIDIHDDIIDQSKTKDGRPTVYGKYGEEIALLIGDALLFKGLTLLTKIGEEGIPTQKMNQIVEIIKDMFFELGNAEAFELQLRNRIDVLPERYLQVVHKKAADVEAHTRIGAIVGGGSEEQIEALGGYGRFLGTMIILRDDWLDLLSLEESLHRIKKECLPLPMLYGLQIPKTEHVLKPILLKKKPSKKDAKLILETIKTSEAIVRYKRLMQTLSKEADSKLRSLPKKAKDLRLFSKAILCT